MLHQRRRNEPRGCGHDDGVERCLLAPAEVSVRVASSHAGKPKPLQAAAGAPCKRSVDLDGEDVTPDRVEHGGLVAGSGADLEDFDARPQLEHLGHVGHDVRLGDGLAESDGERVVPVGARAVFRGNELVSGNARDRVEGGGIAHAVPHDVLHHAVAFLSPIRRLRIRDR